MTGTAIGRRHFETRQMLQNLYEGDLGGHFRTFAFSNAELGVHVAINAHALYKANQTMWPSMGAFACNYLETALRVVEGHVPYRGAGTTCHTVTGKVADEIWYDAAWTKWAEFCASFAMGS